MAILFGGISASLASDDSAEAKGLNAAVVEQVNIINKLIDLGDARKDPILLLAAARLQKSLSDKIVTSSSESHKTSDLIQRAKKYAGKNKAIAALADDVKTEKSKVYGSQNPMMYELFSW